MVTTRSKSVNTNFPAERKLYMKQEIKKEVKPEIKQEVKPEVKQEVKPEIKKKYVFTDEEVIKQIHKQPNPKARRIHDHFMIDKPFVRLEIDLMYLTHDKGYKYVMNIVDAASRYKWSVPMRDRKAKDALKAIKSLNLPWKRIKEVHVDSGVEFRGVFAAYVGDKLHVSPKGHHLRFVESYNGHLAKKIYKLQEIKELRTGKPNSEWIDVLPKLVKKFNNYKTRLIKMKPVDAIKLKSVPQPINKFTKDDLVKHIKLDTVVRRLLRSDERQDVSDGKIYIERKRKTDSQYSIELYNIVDVSKQCDNCLFYHSLEDIITHKEYPARLNYWQLQPV